MTKPITIECDIHFKRRGPGSRKELREGKSLDTAPVSSGRIPRLARLMALAIHFDDLIRAGEVADYAELARLAHVTRARVTQIMNLLMLAPDIQEAILCLPKIERGSPGTRYARLQVPGAIRIQRWGAAPGRRGWR